MRAPRLNSIMRLYMAVIAICGWFALILQFPLSIAISRAKGMSLFGAVVTYFSFFTILTNVLVALGLTSCLCIPNSSWGRFFARTTVRSGLTVYIAMVGVVYSLMLRQLWNPEGLQKIVDVLLHDVVPVLYVLYWLLFVSRNSLPWRSVLLWLVYPLVYLSYTLIRGALSGGYPYPFLDAGSEGYGHVFLSVSMLLAAFAALGSGVLVFSRWRGRRGSREQQSS